LLSGLTLLNAKDVMTESIEDLSLARFNDAADQWDGNSTRVTLAHAIAEAIVTHVPINDGMDALEYGCGTGLVTLALAHRFRTVVALDNAWKMLAVLTDKIKERQIPNVTTCCCDLMQDNLVEQVPSPQQYHLAYSSMTLHHVADAPALLRTLSNALHPAGFLAIADLEKEDGSFHPPDVQIPHHGFERETLSNWFEQAGLTNIQTFTAHTIEREDAEGQVKHYPILLTVGQKPLFSE